MHRASLAAAALLLISSNANAADNGLYLGGSLSRSTIDTNDDLGGFRFEKDEDTAYKIIGGLRLFDALSIEANYVDFGSISEEFPTIEGTATGRFEVRALDAFAVGYLGAPLLEVFGKLGLVYWDAEAVVEGGITHFRDSDNGADIAYGGGVQAHLGSLALRLEYENFEVSDAEKLDLWSLGFTFTFP